MKMLPVGAELFLAVGRTDGRTERHDETNGRFCNLAKATKHA